MQHRKLICIWHNNAKPWRPRAHIHLDSCLIHICLAHVLPRPAALASLSSTATRFEDSPPSEVQHAACQGFRQGQLITPEATQVPLQPTATPHQGSTSSDKGRAMQPPAPYAKKQRVSLWTDAIPIVFGGCLAEREM